MPTAQGPVPTPLILTSGALFLSWKRIRSQQGLQESSSGQSFFVRKQKVRWKKTWRQTRKSRGDKGGCRALCGRSEVRGQGKGPQVEKGVARTEALSLSQVRRAPLSEYPHSLGCYNPVMEDAISYATLRFPFGETDTPRTGYLVRVLGG